MCVCRCVQGAAKALIFPVVQQFTEAFVQALQMPDGPSSDSGLKMEVLKVRSKESSGNRPDRDMNIIKLQIDVNYKFYEVIITFNFLSSCLHAVLLVVVCQFLTHIHVISLKFIFPVLCFLPQAVTALVKNFPKPMVSSMQQILPIVWNTLTESAALYPLYQLRLFFYIHCFLFCL